MPSKSKSRGARRSVQQTAPSSSSSSQPSVVPATASPQVEDDDDDGDELASDDEEDDYGSDEEESYMLGGKPLDLQATAESLMAQQRRDAMPSQVEAVFDLLIWGIPFSALFVLLDIMIQQQYAMHPTLLIEIGRMMGTIPIMMAIIWFTTIRPFAKGSILQLLFFVGAVACGCSFVWTYHQAPFLTVIRRTPPLGCLWIYAIVKLDLLPCVTSLAVVGVFIWHNNLPLINDRM